MPFSNQEQMPVIGSVAGSYSGSLQMKPTSFKLRGIEEIYNTCRNVDFDFGMLWVHLRLDRFSFGDKLLFSQCGTKHQGPQLQM